MKGIACRTYTYMQLYTLCIGWLYFLEMKNCEDLVSMTFSLLKFVCVSVERNECVPLPSETIFHESSYFLSFKLMRNGSPSSNVYRTFLSAVIRTLNPLPKFIGALTSDFVHVSLKITES